MTVFNFVIAIILYICMALFVYGFVQGMDEDDDVTVFMAAAFWPFVMGCLLIYCIFTLPVKGLIKLGNKTGQWVKERSK